MAMGRATPDQIIAHVGLLRAVDQLLEQADAVREKRDALERALSEKTGKSAQQPIRNAEGQRND